MPKKPIKSKIAPKFQDLHDKYLPVAQRNKSKIVPIWGSDCPMPGRLGWEIVVVDLTTHNITHVADQENKAGWNVEDADPADSTTSDYEGSDRPGWKPPPKATPAFHGGQVHAFKITVPSNAMPTPPPPAPSTPSPTLYQVRVVGNPCKSAYFKVS